MRQGDFFLNCYLAVQRPTLGHSQGGRLTNLMLITAFFNEFRPEGHREPRNDPPVPDLILFL